MKISEKVIKRLYNMGVIPNKKPIVLNYHGSRNGSWSWCIADSGIDVGSTSSMKECLSWGKWHFDIELHEIFEYHPHNHRNYNDIIE